MTYFDYSVCSACHSEVGDGEFFTHVCPPVEEVEDG